MEKRKKKKLCHFQCIKYFDIFDLVVPMLFLPSTEVKNLLLSQSYRGANLHSLERARLYYKNCRKGQQLLNIVIIYLLGSSLADTSRPPSPPRINTPLLTHTAVVLNEDIHVVENVVRVFLIKIRLQLHIQACNQFFFFNQILYKKVRFYTHVQ